MAEARAGAWPSARSHRRQRLAPRHLVDAERVLADLGGIEPAGKELVFTNPDGSWIHPHSFSQILDRKVAKLDVSTGLPA